MYIYQMLSSLYPCTHDYDNESDEHNAEELYHIPLKISTYFQNLYDYLYYIRGPSSKSINRGVLIFVGVWMADG